MTRRETLTIAARVFAQNGYHAASLDLVSDQLGVTRQALYYHFRSKGEILGALFDLAMESLESAIAASEPDADGSRFLAMLRAHLSVVVADTDLAALLVHERAEVAKLPGLDAVARRRAYIGRFVAAYEEDITAGVVRPLPPESVVACLIAAVNGVSSWYQTDARASEVAATVYEMVSSGVLRSSSSSS